MKRFFVALNKIVENKLVMLHKDRLHSLVESQNHAKFVILYCTKSNK